MRKIIRHRQIVEDHWQHLDDEQSVPAGPITVTPERWARDRDTLTARKDLVGLRLSGDHELESLSSELTAFPLIALEFPVFKDGRCYTHARLLRERYGYEGELRAVGDVLRDQIFFMHRVGFDAFEVRQDRDIQEALEALNDFTVRYQAAWDERQPLHLRRGVLAA